MGNPNGEKSSETLIWTVSLFSEDDFEGEDEDVEEVEGDDDEEGKNLSLLVCAGFDTLVRVIIGR